MLYLRQFFAQKDKSFQKMELWKWQMIMEKNSDYEFNKVLGEKKKKNISFIFIFKKNQRNFLANPICFILSLFYSSWFERQPCKAIIINMCWYAHCIEKFLYASPEEAELQNSRVFNIYLHSYQSQKVVIS